MIRSMFKTACAAVVLVLVGAGSANAAPITGSVSVVPEQGNILTFSSPTTFLRDAESVTFLNSLLEVLNQGSGDLSVLLTNAPGTIVPGTITENSANTITLGSGGNTFTFTFNGGQFAGNAAFENAVAFEAMGTLTGGTYDATPAVFLLSLNQAGGPGTEVSGGFTIATVQAVPAPAGLALAAVAVPALALRRLARRKA